MSNLQYAAVWQKLLGEDEKIEYEFSIAKRYRVFGIILWTMLSLPLIVIFGLGIVTFLVALFYYGFYVRAANAYAFTNKRVLIHKGWLSTKTISIDYARITDVHVNEPFFDRLITHTGDLAINTAGTTEKEVLLRHIQRPYDVRKKLDSLKG